MSQSFPHVHLRSVFCSVSGPNPAHLLRHILNTLPSSDLLCVVVLYDLFTAHRSFYFGFISGVFFPHSTVRADWGPSYPCSPWPLAWHTRAIHKQLHTPPRSFPRDRIGPGQEPGKFRQSLRALAMLQTISATAGGHLAHQSGPLN